MPLWGKREKEELEQKKEKNYGKEIISSSGRLDAQYIHISFPFSRKERAGRKALSDLCADAESEFKLGLC